MSEVITAPPGGTFPTFGLEVISQGPVTLRNSPTTPAGTVQAIGSSLNDTIRSISTDATLEFLINGGIGDDEISGAAADDRLFGDSGNDTISGNEGDDVIRGNSGEDSLYGNAGGDRLFGDAGNDTAYGNEGDDILFGNDGNDTLRSGAGDDLIYGGSGDDAIHGSLGDDQMFGDNGNDTIRGDVGNDRLDGGAGDDTLFGDAGNDVLIGGLGSDVMTGGRGDDTLVAEAGFDILVGGLGRDRFVFRARSNEQIDTIIDFNPNEDVILLDRSLLPGSGLANGRLRASDFRAVETFTDDITAKIIYEKATGTVFYKPTSGTEIALLQLDRNLPLTASDFAIGTNV